MEFHGIPIGSLWTLVKWFPPFFLKKFFSKSRLADLIYVDLRPRHESATVNLGESASFDIWLNLINLSPFDVELDRAEFRFYYCGVKIKSLVVKKQILRPGEINLLHVTEVFQDGQANQIARTCQSNSDSGGSLSADIEFNCALHDFCKAIPSLDGIHPRLLNATQRCV